MTLFLVGAGVGAAQHLTLWAREVLATADVVLADELVPADVLRLARADARIETAHKHQRGQDPGQQSLNVAALAALGRGERVVRLKSGDPFLFGRGAEELLFFREFGYPVHVVPGLSSAIAVPTLAGIPVTHRGLASQLLVLTAHGRDGEFPDMPTYLPARTLVFLMVVKRIDVVAARLVTLLDYPPTLPAAVIQRGGTVDQRTFFGTLADIAAICARHSVQSPATMVVGRAVNAIGAAANTSPDGSSMLADFHRAAIDESTRIAATEPLFAAPARARDDAFTARIGADACYVDYAGASLPTTAQLLAVSEAMRATALANPHSVGAALAQRSVDAIERAREQLLAHFGVTGRTHCVIFTANATAAAKLVGECFAWPRGVFAHTQINHTSLVGLRQLAHTRGAAVQLLRESADNDWSTGCVGACTQSPCARCLWLTPPPADAATTHCLFAFPAQCNFSGTLYDAERVIAAVRARRGAAPTRVLLDAASFAATHQLDLSRIDADFVCLSMYKLFGFPSGVGCLIAKLDAANELARHRDYFGGGTVASLRIDRIDAPELRGSAKAPWSSLEDGTDDFHGIASLTCGFAALNQQLGGVAAIGERARVLAEWLRDALAQLRHDNGAPVVSLYQCADAARRSSIVAFNVRRADGSSVGFSEVATLARIANVQLRTGCFCNVGACSHYLQWREPHLLAMERAQRTCGDDNDVLRTTDEAGEPLEVQTGAVRVSFGSLSLRADAERVHEFVRRFFVDTTTVAPSPAPSAVSSATIAELWIYPIKSCAGVRVRGMSLPLLRSGLKYDREFVVVDDQDVFLSQKRVPRLALVQPVIDFARETVTLTAPGMEPLELSLVRAPSGAATIDVVVCGARAAAQFRGTGDSWFTQFLGRPCRLARPPDDKADDHTFQNTSALLLVSETSVADLNTRLADTDRIDHRPFRANIVISGAPAFAEDEWRALRVRGSNEPFTLLATGRCNRCQMINVAPDSGNMSDEPLRTLALYRRARGQIAFGVHLSPTAGSVDRLEQRALAEGDVLMVLQ